MLYCIMMLIIASSCISRLARPKLTGTILDFERNPIDNCTVGETMTDKNGKFVLEEKRYNKFFIPEAFMLEAPPLFIAEIIKKEGYEQKEIVAFNKYGGGGGKGTTWHLDTIYLKKDISDFQKIIKNKWIIRANETLDTLYLVRANFNNHCITRNCQDFYFEYNTSADRFIENFNSKKPQKKIIHKLIDIEFLSNDITTLTYENARNHNNETIFDTIQTQEQYNISKDEIIEIKSEFEDLNGSYEIILFDFDYFTIKRLSPIKNSVYE
ncbi:hypothetical protein [Aquimarina algicola]|uniref:hypothetical protein n=1 Tax=Aquimarina algicola TaxID=2589995 RepID=UPI001CF37988|nr:hypothetical protein [Aquimarina algicola]